MTQERVNGVVEFHSFDDDPDIGSQIDKWLQEFPNVNLIDTKYEVVSYVEDNVLKFGTFALVFFHETVSESQPSANRAMTQKMQVPQNAQGKRWRE